MYAKSCAALIAAALLTACSAARADSLAPLPAGWFPAGTGNVSGASSDSYTMGIDAAAKHNGHASAYIGSKGSVGTHTFGTFMQSFSARDYLGKRVKFSGFVKTKDAQSVGLWMRIDDSTTSVRFDNMQNRAIHGTTDWKMYSVVVDVPTNAVTISFGLLDAGSGEAWLNDVSFGTTDMQTPTTDTIGPASLPSAPQNLDFHY